MQKVLEEINKKMKMLISPNRHLVRLYHLQSTLEQLLHKLVGNYGLL